MATVQDRLTGRRLKVFVSYAREDVDAVRLVAEGLETLHHDVWVDLKGLEGGQDWWDKILAQIRDCDAMVVAVSPALLDSEAAAKEREYARQLLKPLLPVAVAPVLANLLPPDIAPLQLVDYSKVGPMTGFQLAAALAALPAAPQLPSPLPPPPGRPGEQWAKLADRVRAERLTLDEQLALVAALRLALDRAPREQAAAAEMLRTLERRRDLYHATWQEVNELVKREKAGQTVVSSRISPIAPPVSDSGPPETGTAPGWYRDPSGRHELRWFAGDWTMYASDNGTMVEDPDF